MIKDDDFLDLTMEEDNGGRPPPGPALIVPEPTPQLEIHEACYRRTGRGGIIFVDPDEQTGEPIFMNAEQYQRLMRWPRLPTLEEAEQWQARQVAIAMNTLWDALNPGQPWD